MDFVVGDRVVLGAYPLWHGMVNRVLIVDNKPSYGVKWDDFSGESRLYEFDLLARENNND